MKNRFLIQRSFQLLPALILVGILGFSSCTQNVNTTSAGGSDSSAVKVNEEAAKPEAATETGVKIAKGTFVSMEWGDYLHFNMKNEAGEDMSFFVMDLPEDQIAQFEKPEMAGKAIQVKWKTSKRDIPESGGEMELDEILDVQLIK